MAIEHRNQTEEMRHIPSVDWLATKLDYDYRERIHKLYDAVYRREDAPEGTRERGTARFRTLCKWLQRITTVARDRKPDGHKDLDLHTDLDHSVYEAVAALSSMERNYFRRRTPFHLMERSRGEQIWEAFLAVGAVIDELSEIAREIDPDITARILEPHAPPEPRPVVFRDDQ